MENPPLIKRINNIIISLRALAFNEAGIGALEALSGRWMAVIAFLLCVGLQSLPTSVEEVAVFPQMYLLYAVKFAICLALVIILARILGSKTPISKFVTVTALAYTYAMALTTLLAYLSLVVFESVLGVTVVTGVIISFIPYYTSVLFGWTAETVSQLSTKRAIVLGMAAITLLLVYILYIDPLLCGVGIMNALGLANVLC